MKAKSKAGNNKTKKAVKRKCVICGKARSKGYYNRHYKDFICFDCAEEQEAKPYGRYCEICGRDMFLEAHKKNCPEK